MSNIIATWFTWETIRTVGFIAVMTMFVLAGTPALQALFMRWATDTRERIEDTLPEEMERDFERVATYAYEAWEQIKRSEKYQQLKHDNLEKYHTMIKQGAVNVAMTTATYFGYADTPETREIMSMFIERAVKLAKDTASAVSPSSGAVVMDVPGQPETTRPAMEISDGEVVIQKTGTSIAILDELSEPEERAA